MHRPPLTPQKDPPMPLAPSCPRPAPHTSARGQSLVEFALVVPILLLMFAGAADMGRIFYTFVAIENASKEGALYGARYPLCDDASTLCPDPGNVEWRTRTETTNVIQPANLTVVASCIDGTTGVAHLDLRDCKPGDTYEVSTSTPFRLITPLLDNVVGPNFTLASTSRASVLNLAFDPTPGVAPVKLVLATGSRNLAEIQANCSEPDPSGSPGYYRSPCLNQATGATYPIKFRVGDPIFYKITARNSGGTNLTGVTMTDSRGWPGACSSPPTSMPVGGAQYVCTYSRTAPSIPGSGVTMDYANTYTVDANEILATTDGATVTVEKPPADLRVFTFLSPYKEGDDGDGNPFFGTNDAISLGRTASVPTVYAWYRLTVQNIGGQPATGVTISDTRGPIPFGTNNATAECDPAPGSLAVGGLWMCRYRVAFTTDQVATNTVSATATGVTPDAGDSDTATVTVAGCGAGLRSVPDLIGLTKTLAANAWTAAGFTGALSTWSGSNGSVAVTQNRMAFTCLAPSTTVTITRTATP